MICNYSVGLFLRLFVCRFHSFDSFIPFMPIVYFSMIIKAGFR